MKLSKIEHAFYNQATDNKDEFVLVISGAIGEGGYFYDATSASNVRKALKDVKAKTVRIKLNSPGGDVFNGLEIYNYLKDLDAHVVVEVTALAASAASIIAMGADEIIMRTGSNMMIHNASTFAYGNKEDLLKAHDALSTIDSSIIDVYKAKTGLDDTEIKELLDNETWFTAQEAVEKGFADSVETTKDKPSESTNTVENQGLLKAINELKQEITNLKANNENQEVKEKVKNTDKSSVNGAPLKSLLF